LRARPQAAGSPGAAAGRGRAHGLPRCCGCPRLQARELQDDRLQGAQEDLRFARARPREPASMKLTAEACLAFEHDISLFVDHELDAAGSDRLVSHLESCDGCRDYLEDLRGLAEMHREAAAADVEARAVAELVDRHALFASITRTLVQEKRAELAR